MTTTTPTHHPTDGLITKDQEQLADEGSLLVEDQRFAIIPEWVIDAELPDAAFRLYALLLRYGNGSGHRMPARATLARRMSRSVDAVDRAMRQLVDARLVRVEHRKAGKQYLSNRYHVRTSSPFPSVDSQAGRGGRNSAATPTEPGQDSTTDALGGGRRSAATPVCEGGRTNAAAPSRTSAPGVAADVRPDREISTERTPPPPAAPTAERTGRRDAIRPGTAVEDEKALLDACGIDDLEGLAERCVTARRALGQPVGRWRAPCLLVAVKLAVVTRGWPAVDVLPALLAVAADPATHSPVRVAEAGPWWDRRVTDTTGDVEELAELEARLAELDGQRLLLQRQAREELTTEGLPVTRATVTRRACDILDRQTVTAGVAS